MRPLTALALLASTTVANQILWPRRERPSPMLRLVPPEPPPEPMAEPAIDWGSQMEADCRAIAEKLAVLGIPHDLDRSKPRRIADTPRVAADRFGRYVLATRPIPSEPMSAAEVKAAYLRFCRVDHREPCGLDPMLGFLARLPYVHRRELVIEREDGGRNYRRVYEFRRWRAQRSKTDVPKAA